MTFQPVSPKPFTYIQPSAAPDRKPPTGHDQYYEGTFSGHIDMTLQAVTPVCVASGTVELGQTTGRTNVMRDMVRRLNTRYIPGSSLKGCVRSTLEAISASCIRVTKARIDEIYKGCSGKARLCVACRLFGSLGYEGRIVMGDALQQVPTHGLVALFPALYAPKSRSTEVRRKIYHTHTRSLTGGHIPTEVYRRIQYSVFRVRFENLVDDELGLLLTALGLREGFKFKLGGGRPVGFGQLRPGIRGIALRAPQDAYRDWDAPPEKIYQGPEIGTIVKKMLAADALLVKAQWQSFITAVRKEHEPPAGAY